MSETLPVIDGLSEDAKAVLKYFWTSSPDNDPAFVLKAVQAGVHPEKFVEACINSISDLSPEAEAVANNMAENRAEAAQYVAGVLGLT